MKLMPGTCVMLAFLLLGCQRVDHSKDKFCNTLPVQCVEPAHKTEGESK